MFVAPLAALAIAATPPTPDPAGPDGRPLRWLTEAGGQRLALSSSFLADVADVAAAALPPPVSDPVVSAPTSSARQGPRALTVGLVSVGMASVVLTTGAIAWWDRGFDQLHFANTGFFGRDTYAGGSDKLGHFFCTYVSMSAMTPLYQAVGVSHDGAVLGATLFTLLLWNGFEVIDGFTDYGVEYGDMVMNTLGISLGAAMQMFPVLPTLVGLRLGYVPSRDFLAHEKSMLKFINDYSGMLYYLDVKLKGVLELSGVDPGLGRYVVGGLVFGTDHYSPVREHELRRRSFGFHVGLSLAEILRGFGDGDKGVEIMARFFDFYAVPFLSVAVMKDLNSERWFLNFGVANRSEVALGSPAGRADAL